MKGLTYNAKPWSPEQIAWVRDNAATTPRIAMAEYLGCSITLVNRRLNSFGLFSKRQRGWTPEEDETLRSMAGRDPVSQIAATLKRGKESVFHHARRLGLSLIYPRAWPSEDDSRLRELVAAGRCVPEIAAITGRTKAAVYERLQTIGIHPVPPPRKQPAPKPPRPPRAARPARVRVQVAQVRERKGIPQPPPRKPVTGTVAICDRCHAPVVDTPERWAEHNQRVHVAPIFAVPCSTRRIA